MVGVAAGIIGALQALEVLKFLADLGPPLEGRLLTFDGENTEFRQVQLKKDPACPVCGTGQPG